MKQPAKYTDQTPGNALGLNMPRNLRMPPAPISMNTLHDTVLREAIAQPFVRRTAIRQNMGAAWLEARAAMTDDLYHAQGRIMEYVTEKLRIPGMAASIGVLLLDIALAVNQCTTTTEIERLFQTCECAGGAGDYANFHDWAAVHLDALHAAEQDAQASGAKD